MATTRKSQGTPKSVSTGKDVVETPRTKAERREARAQAVAALRKEQARRDRRGRLLTAGGVILAVVIVVAAVVAIGLNHKQKGAATTAASDAVLTGITTVPAATYDKVGTGKLDTTTAPKAIGGDPLTADGKPRILYVGAEYCPYCAAERWSVVAALSRFGTFSGLGQTASTPKDVFPSTPTLSFHGATYTSQYVSFSGYETEDTDEQPLDTVPKDDEALVSKYDGAPYFGDSGSIPFIDLFGTYATQGASYSPGILAGKTHTEVADAMQDPTSTIAQNVDAQANVFSAIICQATGQQPADVCTSAGVKAAAKQLPAAAPSGS